MNEPSRSPAEDDEPPHDGYRLSAEMMRNRTASQAHSHPHQGSDGPVRIRRDWKARLVPNDLRQQHKLTRTSARENGSTRALPPVCSCKIAALVPNTQHRPQMGDRPSCSTFAGRQANDRPCLAVRRHERVPLDATRPTCKASLPRTDRCLRCRRCSPSPHRTLISHP